MIIQWHFEPKFVNPDYLKKKKLMKNYIFFYCAFMENILGETYFLIISLSKTKTANVRQYICLDRLHLGENSI